MSGHEIDVVADHGSHSIGIELKAGMTVIPEFFKGLTYWQSLTKYDKCYLIYGGEETQKRSNGIEVIPWNKSDIFDAIA